MTKVDDRPANGAEGQFAGKDSDGRLWLIRWSAADSAFVGFSYEPADRRVLLKTIGDDEAMEWWQ